MGAIASEVTAKVRLRSPDLAGRWTDADIQKLVHLADLAVKESCETYWAAEEINLHNGTMYYGLPDNIIAVRSVEFSSDGTDYDYVVKPIIYDELDGFSYKWPDHTGTIPEYFLVFSAPGVNGYSRIMIWRPIATVTNEKIRVNCIKCYPENNADFLADTAPAGFKMRSMFPIRSP